MIGELINIFLKVFLSFFKGSFEREIIGELIGIEMIRPFLGFKEAFLSYIIMPIF